MSYRPIALAACFVAAMLTVPTCANGQPTTRSGNRRHKQEASNNKPQLEDIIITGTGRSYSSEYVQAGSFRGARQIDTPLTVSVIPEEVLKSQQAQMLLDALRNTPGVTSSQTSPTVYNNLSIRGIPVENRGNFRLNGSLPIVNLVDQPLEDKERVEALKGASALYYGFTTPSGIINLTAKRPRRDPVLVFEGLGNDHGQLIGHVDAGIGNDWIAGRINIAGGNVDSGIERTRGQRFLGAGALQVKAGDHLKLNLDVERIAKTVTEPTILQGPTAAARLLQVLPRLPAPDTNPGSEGFLNRAHETNVLTRAEWKFSPAWSLVGEAGISYARRDRRFSRLINFDPVTGKGTLNATVALRQLYRNRNARMELAGTFATGPFTQELLIGASRNIRRQYSPLAVTVSTTGATGGCVQLGLSSNCQQSGYDPVPLRDILFSPATDYDPTRDTSIDDTGFYAFDRMKFGGRTGELISLLGGVRKSIYREKQKTPTGEITTFADNPLSFSGAVVVKPRSWASAYATYIEGLEPTPVAPTGTANQGEVLPASKSKQYEAGLKIEPHRGLLFTAAYFDIRRQLTYTNAANIFVKDGRATYRGEELGLTGEVTRNWSLYASALFLNARQGLTSDPTLIGNVIENTAKTQWSVSSEYRLPGVLNAFAVNGGVYWTGRRAINPQNTLFLPGYTLFDAGASYRFEVRGKELEARVYAQNIAHKRYFSSTGGNFIAYGPPASVKFSLSARLF